MRKMYSTIAKNTPDNKGHGANMAPTWGQYDSGWPHVGNMNLAFWVHNTQLEAEYIWRQ